MVRGSWPISGHPHPRSLLYGPRTRMLTDESRASDQRSSTRPWRWFSRRAGPRHRHRRAFSWRVETGLEIVDGFLEELKLGLVISSSFVSSIHSLDCIATQCSESPEGRPEAHVSTVPLYSILLAMDIPTLYVLFIYIFVLQHALQCSESPEGGPEAHVSTTLLYPAGHGQSHCPLL